MLSLTPLYLLAVLGLLIWIWQASLHAHEVAATAAVQACRAQDCQLLEGGAVALQRMRLIVNTRGGLALQRTYRFDYLDPRSEGEAPQQGFIILTGYHLDSVGFAANSGASDASESIRRKN